MAIYSYLRESTPDQEERENGLNAQRDAIGAVDGEFVDILSGATGLDGLAQRPALMELISRLRKGDVVKIYRRDRMSRGDPVLAAMIERAITRKGAVIKFADGSPIANENDPNSVLFVRMLDAFAEYERLIIKARTRGALRAKKERAERTGSVPYGYQVRDGNDKQLVVNENEQQAIAVIKELRARGESLQKIANHLSINGFKTKRGHTKWHKQTISNILRFNPSQAMVNMTLAA